MTMFNVKWVSHTDEFTDNYNQSLQFPFGLPAHCFGILSAILLFWFIITTLTNTVSKLNPLHAAFPEPEGRQSGQLTHYLLLNCSDSTLVFCI